MITSTFFIAVGAYITFSFAFAAIWNLVLFKGQYHELTYESAREKPLIPLGLLAIIIQAIALSSLFSVYYTGLNPLGEGLMLGLIVGSFSIMYGALVVPAKFKITSILQYTALELLYGILHFTTAGILFAYIFL